MPHPPKAIRIDQASGFRIRLPNLFPRLLDMDHITFFAKQISWIFQTIGIATADALPRTRCSKVDSENIVIIKQWQAFIINLLVDSKDRVRSENLHQKGAPR